MRFDELPGLPTVTVVLRGAELVCTVPTQAMEMLVGEKIPIRVSQGRTHDLNAEFKALQVSDYDLQATALAGLVLGLGEAPGTAEGTEPWRKYAQKVAQHLTPLEIRTVLETARAGTAKAEQERVCGKADADGNTSTGN